MAENKKMPDASDTAEQKITSDISDKLKAVEAVQRKRASDEEKKRLAEEKQARLAAEQKQAELEYAENYRRKLLKERKRAEAQRKAKEKEARERAEAMANEARAKAVNEILERERAEAQARSERATALLNRVTKCAVYDEDGNLKLVDRTEVIGTREVAVPVEKSEEPKAAADTPEQTVSEEPKENITEESIPREDTAEPVSEVSEPDVQTEDVAEPVEKTEEPVTAEPAKSASAAEGEAAVSDDGERMILTISDDRFLLNISPDGLVTSSAGPAVPPDVKTVKADPTATVRPVTPEEVLEREGIALSVKSNITVATEDGEETVDEKVVTRTEVKSGAEPVTASNEVVRNIKLLGRAARTKSDFNKYLAESHRAIKKYTRQIVACDEALKIENINLSNTTSLVVDSMRAEGAIIEIRCDNLKRAARFGLKNKVAEFKSELSADIDSYNTRAAGYATYTGEQLTRISQALPERIASGTGVEVIPVLSYRDSYVEFTEDSGEDNGSTYVLNLPAVASQAITLTPSDRGHKSRANNGVSKIMPIYPDVTAEQLLLGAHVYDGDTYREYTKIKKSAYKHIDSMTARLYSDVTPGESERCGEALVEILALEREKLLIAFNTLSASANTSSNRLIAQARCELLDEMARYNKLVDECSAAIGVKLSPARASMADDVLAGKTKVDLPRIARLTELVERVGDEERVIGKRNIENAGASCTLVINAGGSQAAPKTDGKKKRPGGIRTVIGHFFIGGTARRGDGSPDNELATLASAAAVGAGAAMAIPTAAGVSPEDAIATAAVTGGVIASAAMSEAKRGVAEEADNADTEADISALAVANAASADDENEGEPENSTPPVMPEELRPTSYEKSKAEREPVVVSADDMAKAEAARAEREERLAKTNAEAEPEAISTDELPEAEQSVPESAAVSEAPISDNAVPEAQSVEDIPETEPEAPVAKKTAPRRYIPEPEREYRDIPREIAPEEPVADEPVVPEAPIEEAAVTEQVTEELIDDGAEDYVPEEDDITDERPDVRVSLKGESEDEPVAEQSAAEPSGEAPLADDEPKKKKIRLVQKAPPKREEGEGADGAAAQTQSYNQQDGAPIYPGNVINKSEYVDEDDYNADDISNLPPVIEIDDTAEEIENDVLIKPTRSGLKKHLSYVDKKIKKLKRERERFARKKSRAKSIVPRVKNLISVIGCQKQIIDWYCNAMSACCDVNEEARAKKVGRRLKREIRLYNKFVKEYEKLTDDRLTRASLDIPKDILDGEDYQIIPKVTFREAEGPEDGTVYSDGVTETADYVNEYSNDIVMNQRDLQKHISKSEREIAKLKRELDDKVKEKHGAWGVEKTLLMVDCLGIQKKIIDTTAGNLRASCQVSAVKKMQSIKRDLAYEIRQYNKLVDEYKATSGNKLTKASESIPKDIILGNLYTPIPIVGCIYGRGSDDELNGEIAAMSRNVYGVEDDDESTASRAAFRSQVASQANKDLTMLTKRADHETSMLESERDMLSYRFGKEPGEVKAQKRRIAKRLEEIRKTHKLALKYENSDNRRYYAVVTSNPKTMSVKRGKVDRTRVALLRSKVIKLLNERDIVNGKLMALYSGIGMNLDGTSKNQTLRRIKNAAASKSKKKQRALAKFVKELPVSTGEKTKFYNLMNSKVDAESTLALTKYRLRREKLHSEDKLCAKQDVRDLKAKIRSLNRDINDLVKNMQGRLAVAEAGSSWYFAFVVVLLLIIAAVAAVVYLFGNEISALIGK
ncbi:MAG: hypothetical protein IJX92_04015 [Clostridia bacterium]|nr:hypothetical protein [Clostridia bacterium]